MSDAFAKLPTPVFYEEGRLAGGEAAAFRRRHALAQFSPADDCRDLTPFSSSHRAPASQFGIEARPVIRAKAGIGGRVTVIP